MLGLFLAWISPSGLPRGKEMWWLFFLAVIWIIWKERNSRCFDGVDADESILKDRIKVTITSWVMSNSSFKGYSIVQIVRNLKEVAGLC